MLVRLTCFVVALHSATAQYTIDEVAMHSSRDDCWTAVDSTVYDLTAYAPNHIVDTIYNLCGIDGSSIFNAVHDSTFLGVVDNKGPLVAVPPPTKAPVPKPVQTPVPPPTKAPIPKPVPTLVEPPVQSPVNSNMNDIFMAYPMESSESESSDESFYGESESSEDSHDGRKLRGKNY